MIQRSYINTFTVLHSVKTVGCFRVVTKIFNES